MDIEKIKTDWPARRRDLEIARIDAAFKRVEEDAYGGSVSCGEKIAAKRLRLDAMAPIRVACAAAV